MKHFLYAVWEVVEVVLIAVIVVIIVRNFLIQPFLVSGASMEPNFSNFDYLLVEKVTYRFRDPQRSEVIVFHHPKGNGIYYIKRIIGLPGERVKIKDGIVSIYNNYYLDGLILEENYLLPNVKTFNNKEITLNDGEYFVLGDNRHHSFDSRNWGALDEDMIIGLVRLRLWPFDDIMIFNKPIY